MARPRKVWPSLCCIVCDIKLLYRQSFFLKQAAGRVHIDLFDLPQLLHGGGLGLRGDRGADHAVDHGLEGIRRQSIQIQEVLLTDIPSYTTPARGMPCPAAKISAWSRMDTTACIRESAPMMVPALPASSRK